MFYFVRLGTSIFNVFVRSLGLKLQLRESYVVLSAFQQPQCHSGLMVFSYIPNILKKKNMKLAILSTLFASAAAFAPASSGRAATQVSETKVCSDGHFLNKNLFE